MGRNPEDGLDGCELDFKEEAVSDEDAQALVSESEEDNEDEDADQDGEL